MLRIALRLGYFAMSALVSVVARANGIAPESDARCVIVSLEISNLPNETEHLAGMKSALFFLGRLDGHIPKLNIERLIAREMLKMTSSDIRTEAIRCGGMLTEKGELLQRIGSDISRQGVVKTAK
jgi:hypothetical protein